MSERMVIKSVGRVFEILECFTRTRQPLSAIEVGKRLDYPPSSTAAILKSMVVLGYLSLDRVTRTYFPTIRLTLLTNWIDAATLGNTRLDSVIESLREQTGEGVVIAAQNDLEAQYLLVRPGIYPARFTAPVGALRPLCGSGAGWALLSVKTNKEVRVIVDKINRGLGRRRPVDVAALLHMLDQVRAQNYATSYGNVIDGNGIISMVLPTLKDARTLVAGITGPVERLQKNEASIVSKMRTTIAKYFPHHES